MNSNSNRQPQARGATHPRLRDGVAFASLILVLATTPYRAASAHGYAGQRFFPATLATDDPFVADELSLPTLSRRKTSADGDPTNTETSAAIDFTKRITDHFALGFGATYLQEQQAGKKAQHGFDNLSTNVKYQFYKSDAHETILSVGADWDIGGTGSKRLGVDSFSTVTPTAFFGKGFGDLPDGARFLRPFAVTGSVGFGIPTRTGNRSFDDDGAVVVDRNPSTLQTGFAIEYSIPYLQAFVENVGLREPFSRMIPLVEVALEKPGNRGRGPTTGTVNPGVLLPGKYLQLGIEAVIPVNRRTPGKTGVLVQLHFFVDDLFPRTLGRPLFGD